MKTQRGSRSIAILLFNLCARCGVWATPIPAWERPDTHCTGSWVGCTADLDGCGKSLPIGIRSSDLPASGESLYELHYPGPHEIYLQSTNLASDFSLLWSVRFSSGAHPLSYQVGIAASFSWNELARAWNWVDCVWNVMEHAQEPDFVFRRNGRGHLNWQGHQFSRILTAEVCESAVVMLDIPSSEVGWRVLAYPLQSSLSPSLPLPCVTVCHHASTGLYPPPCTIMECSVVQHRDTLPVPVTRLLSVDEHFVLYSTRFYTTFSCNLTVLLKCRISAVNTKVVLDANT